MIRSLAVSNPSVIYRDMDTYWREYVDFIKSKGNIEEVVIIDSTNGAMWASSDPDHFYLREYKAMITQEDGNEVEELVNEALNVVKFMKGEKPSQGLRINGGKKHQVTRSFKDEATGLPVIYSKIPNGGSCIANAGKCILLATFNEAKNHSSPECNDVVQLMAMYLNKSTWPDKDDDLPGAGSEDMSSVSWQTHVEKALVGRGNVADAMIVAVDSGKILASSSPDFQVTVTQSSSSERILKPFTLRSYRLTRPKSHKRTAQIDRRPWMS